jgi:hypothetical protein
MLHPLLPAGYDETTTAWTAFSVCGKAVNGIKIPNDDGTKALIWNGGNPALNYDSSDDIFRADVSGNCSIVEPDGTDITSSTSFTAYLEMDWSGNGTVTLVWEEV